MFDINAARSWWNFFHRFSFLYRGPNFDYILILGINLLQCEACRKDATQFSRSLENHKTPFEKMHILHNYVNRKLKKDIMDIEDAKILMRDVENNKKTKLINYYFDLLFLMSNYIEPWQLQDLKEFSAHIYKSLAVNKKILSLAINVSIKKKFNRETLKMQIYQYYRDLLNSCNIPEVKSFSEIYGHSPTKIITCTQCRTPHSLYIEDHNIPNNIVRIGKGKVVEGKQSKRVEIKKVESDHVIDPKINKKIIPIRKIRVPKRELIFRKSKTIKYQQIITPSK